MADLPRDSSDSADEPDRTPQNPFAGTPFEQIFSSITGGDPAGLQAMFGQLQRMFAPHDGAVNWELARDVARQVVAQEPDRSPDSADVARVQDAARLAEHWLDGATDFPATSSTVAAWSRAEWVEASMPAWQQLVEPVAESVVAAMGKAIPAEALAMAGPMLGMLNQIGSAMFSQQIGQAVGGLSQEVVSATDVGFAVGTDPRPAIVLRNAQEFGAGLGVDESDVLLYLVLRECAHQRLYAQAPWLREHLFSAIEDYGRGISIDTSAIEQQMRSIDPSNMEAIQEALSGGLFDLEHSPAQQSALTRLETTLALIEGWVDEVVSQATEKAMPQAQALREAVRRRRASGGPAEATFAALVGLELRPRRLRDAAALWGALRAGEGAAGRDAVWAHPDLLPQASDLDDPLAFAERTREADEIDVDSAEFDAQLTALLDKRTPGEETDEPPGDSRHQHDEGDAPNPPG
ncbi:MAG: zinc-dependent metalloprotease [Propionibacteriales bacterium]|nr:zinc-dependent metalloprotease [Propionibacteriales bacterium]